MGSIPGLGRSPGEGKDTLSIIPAWRIPWTAESMGLQRVRHNWATFKHQIEQPLLMHSFYHLWAFDIWFSCIFSPALFPWHHIFPPLPELFCSSLVHPLNPQDSIFRPILFSLCSLSSSIDFTDNTLNTNSVLFQFVARHIYLKVKTHPFQGLPWWSSG